jgi:hypothetical protein
MTQTCHSDKDQRFLKEFNRIRREWFNADGDTEKSDTLMMDLFMEIEDYFEIPLGN